MYRDITRLHLRGSSNESQLSEYSIK